MKVRNSSWCLLFLRNLVLKRWCGEILFSFGFVLIFLFFLFIFCLFAAVGANGGASTKRYRRVGRNDAASRKRELQRAAAAEAEAEAVEALAEIAAGPSMGNSDMAESSSR